MLLKDSQLERVKKREPLWGHWVIGARLGSGSFGCVYEALDQKKIEPTAALKIMTVESEPQDEIQYGKDREACLKNKLDNVIGEIRRMIRFRDYPNFVAYHEFDYFPIRDNRGNLLGYDILIRMEKLRSLSDDSLDRWKTHGKITEEEVIRLGIDICTGLKDAGREAAFMHRDIKPDNIFVSGRGVYKLGDLGISGMNQSKRDSICGTPVYMAPEIWFGRGYHADVDLYALGLVMYELLNGALPFENMSDALAMRLGGITIPRLTSINAELADIIARAVEFKPEKRWQTASDMLEALQTCGKKKVPNTKKASASGPVFTPKTAPDVKKESASGWKRIVYPNGDVYEGTICKMYRRGGINYDRFRRNKSGAYYEAAFADEKLEGKGRYIKASGDIFEGNFICGRLDGHGKRIYPNGHVFEGEYIDGMRHGRGKDVYSDGRIVEHEYVKGNIVLKGLEPDEDIADFFDL